MNFPLKLCSIFMVCIVFLGMLETVLAASTSLENSLDNLSSSNDEEKFSKAFELNENQKKIMDDDEIVKKMLENLKFFLIVSKNAHDLKKRRDVKRRHGSSTILRFNPQTSKKFDVFFNFFQWYILGFNYTC